MILGRVPQGHLGHLLVVGQELDSDPVARQDLRSGNAVALHRCPPDRHCEAPAIQEMVVECGRKVRVAGKPWDRFSHAAHGFE